MSTVVTARAAPSSPGGVAISATRSRPSVA
jgi:hypothetical protein